MVTGVALTATPVTIPVASTVAMVGSLDAHVTAAVVTVLFEASCAFAVSVVVEPAITVDAPVTVTWSSGPAG